MYSVIKNDLQAVEVIVNNRIIYIKLIDGTIFEMPASSNKRLSQASEKDLSNVELICGGTGLHWEDLDEDLSIRGILDGRFG